MLEEDDGNWLEMEVHLEASSETGLDKGLCTLWEAPSVPLKAVVLISLFCCPALWQGPAPCWGPCCPALSVSQALPSCRRLLLPEASLPTHILPLPAPLTPLHTSNSC